MNRRILKKAIEKSGGTEADYNWMNEQVGFWEDKFLEKVWKTYFEIKNSYKSSSRSKTK